MPSDGGKRVARGLVHDSIILCVIRKDQAHYFLEAEYPDSTQFSAELLDSRLLKV
jgi:hypothetical protein